MLLNCRNDLKKYFLFFLLIHSLNNDWYLIDGESCSIFMTVESDLDNSLLWRLLIGLTNAKPGEL